MTVHVRSEHPRGRAAVRRLRQRAGRFLAALGRDQAELSILVVGDAAIRRLNAAWRRKDRATDVLSFPAAGEGPLLGDVVISLDTAVRASREEHRALGAELDRYLAHGLLHLLGHDHQASAAAARRMAEAEDALVGEGMVTASRWTPGRPRGRGPGRRTARARPPHVKRSRSTTGAGGSGAEPPTSKARSRRQLAKRARRRRRRRRSGSRS